MRIADFDLYQELLLKRSGLELSADQSYLLDSRLTPVAKKWGYPSLESMTVALRAVPEPDMVKDVVEAMTTTDTSFFRDRFPFEHFVEVVLPYMAANRGKKSTLRIWCNACSKGQEAYSLAMAIHENKETIPNLNIEIIGTDLSEAVLDIAKTAQYSQFEVQRGLPIRLLIKYFEQADKSWHLKEEIKNMVKFENFNLLDNMDSLETFDVIFCRNVLTYFNEKTKIDVLQRLGDKLAEDGFLFTGDSENISDFSDDYEAIDDTQSLYVVKGSRHSNENNKQSASK